MTFTALGRGLLPIAVAFASVTAACTGRDNDESMDSGYEGRNEGSEVAPPAMEPAGGTLTDENIVTQIGMVNTMDSTMGRMAAQKGTNRQVREFGQRMAREHGSAQQQVNQVAQQLNLGTAQSGQGTDRQRMEGGAGGTGGTGSTGAMAENQMQHMRDSLQNMPRGAAWDRAYIDHEVTAHEQALDLLTRAENSTQRQELKDLVNKLAPVVQDHLTKAREIQQQLQQGNTEGQDNQQRNQ